MLDGSAGRDDAWAAHYGSQFVGSWRLFAIRAVYPSAGHARGPVATWVTFTPAPLVFPVRRHRSPRGHRPSMVRSPQSPRPLSRRVNLGVVVAIHTISARFPGNSFLPVFDAPKLASVDLGSHACDLWRGCDFPVQGWNVAPRRMLHAGDRSLPLRSFGPARSPGSAICCCAVARTSHQNH